MIRKTGDSGAIRSETPTRHMSGLVEKSEMIGFATKWPSYGRFILISILHTLIWLIAVT